MNEDIHSILRMDWTTRLQLNPKTVTSLTKAEKDQMSIFRKISILFVQLVRSSLDDSGIYGSLNTDTYRSDWVRGFHFSALDRSEVSKVLLVVFGVGLLSLKSAVSGPIWSKNDPSPS